MKKKEILYLQMWFKMGTHCYLTKKRLEKMAQLNYESTCLMHFMDRDKNLWDEAKDDDEYVVGVMEDSKSKPMKASRHYFTNQKDAMNFYARCNDKGLHLERRHPETWLGINNFNLKMGKSGLTKEKLEKMVPFNVKSDALSNWLNKNSKKIFAEAPNNELYAAAVYRDHPTKPEVHYFNDKMKEVMPFIAQCYKNDEVAYFIYRHQDELILIL